MAGLPTLLLICDKLSGNPCYKTDIHGSYLTVIQFRLFGMIYDNKCYIPKGYTILTKIKTIELWQRS